MVNLENLFDQLKKNQIRFFTGVPDSFLNDFCQYLCKNYSERHHIMAANEGNAIAIAAGYYLATHEIPVVYMQNSGIGNATNPLLSLAHNYVYGIPMILLIGWRGDPEYSDHAQHKKQGELTPILLKDMDIPFRILDCAESVNDNFEWAKEKATHIQAPVALIVKKGILTQKEKKQAYPENELMTREEVISQILDIMGDEAMYLATTGRCTRELHAQLELRNWNKKNEFLNVGAMGHLSSIALGIAIASPEKKVIIFDGDAAAIMHLGSLATIGRYKPSNIIHIVLNNGANESVGGQESSGNIISLSTVASACGYDSISLNGENLADLKNFILKGSLNPKFIDFRIRQGIRPDLPKLDINHHAMKESLIQNLNEKSN